MSTSLSPLPTPATDSTSVISPAEVAHEVTPDPTDNLSAPGPSVRAADKWVKANGPPVGVTFGARKLNEEQDVWEHNAWDHVELPQDYLEKAQERMEFHKANPVSEHKRDEYNTQPARFWDSFYEKNQAAFFKDRAWLRSEFPELIECSEADAGPKTVLEVGCGAGNSVFTLMRHNENPELNVFATDYSAEAVKVVQSNPIYPVPPHGKGKMRASVWDITATPDIAGRDSGDELSEQLASTSLESKRPAPDCFLLPEGVEPGTVDVITVIYVLSALHPKEWEQAIHNLYTALKPGGVLLLRDYGRNDLTQIRIKKDRLLDPDVPHLYIRGDGTRVYFFEKEELERLVTASPREETAKREMFEVLQLGEDRRMLVNRKERKQMYRIWLQVKARKL